MILPKPREILAALMSVTLIAACSTSDSSVSKEGDTILPSDTRFNVFQLSNSAGDGSNVSAQGKVYLSFRAHDSRYCRAARFHIDRTAILACRNQRGWQVEATSELRSNSNGVTPAVNDAVFRLNPEAEFLNEREIIEAAQNNWL